jgi:hypothetical protein
MTNVQTHGLNFERPDNVVVFPRTCRARAAVLGAARPPLHHNRRPIAVTGAELNARLLILLGICTTSAAIVLSVVHMLQG